MNENLNGIEIRKSSQILPIWKGKNISDTYGKKPVLNYAGNPVFAELYALKEYSENGFNGVWADTFRNKFRTELPEKNEPEITLPEFVSETLKK